MWVNNSFAAAQTVSQGPDQGIFFTLLLSSSLKQAILISATHSPISTQSKPTTSHRDLLLFLFLHPNFMHK
jgi:hypothetical protein